MTCDPTAPILLLDSGIGGLSVLEELRRILPDAPIIYVADTAALPYGTKSEAEIAARVPALLGRMVERYRPRLVTIACNTASTIALSAVRDILDVPVVGTVPAIKPAAAITRSGVIGLLGTAATVRQTYVDQLERQFAHDKRLIRHAAPELVAAAEAKIRGQEAQTAAIEAAVHGLLAQPGGKKIDTVVLACTHFPFVAQELGQLMGPQISFVDGATGIAHRIAYLGRGQKFIRQQPDLAVFTGTKPLPQALIRTLHAHGLTRIERF